MCPFTTSEDPWRRSSMLWCPMSCSDKPQVREVSCAVPSLSEAFGWAWTKRVWLVGPPRDSSSPWFYLIFLSFSQNHFLWLAPFSAYSAHSVCLCILFIPQRRCLMSAKTCSCWTSTSTSTLPCCFSRWCMWMASSAECLPTTICLLCGSGLRWLLAASAALPLALLHPYKSNLHLRWRTIFPERLRLVLKLFWPRSGFTRAKLPFGGHRTLWCCSAADFMLAWNNWKWRRSIVSARPTSIYDYRCQH